MTDEASNDVVLVAPRELHDLVYRGSRIAGSDPGTANELATEWTTNAVASGSDPAMHGSVAVKATVFDRLVSDAAGYLVSEGLLDDLAAAEAEAQG